MNNVLGRRARRLVVLSSLLAACCAQAVNPIVPGWYAGPEIRIFNARHWLYPTYSADAGVDVGAVERPEGIRAQAGGFAVKNAQPSQRVEVDGHAPSRPDELERR